MEGGKFGGWRVKRYEDQRMERLEGQKVERLEGQRVEMVEGQRIERLEGWRKKEGRQAYTFHHSFLIPSTQQNIQPCVKVVIEICVLSKKLPHLNRC